MRNSAGVFWLHGDHLGSASLITTNAGATSGQLRYDPYGQRRVASGNIWTEYTFTDQRQELSVGLMDYDARLYSPLLARFISPDPIVPDAANVQDWNRYAYVRHNPMKYKDPSGHCPVPSSEVGSGGVICLASFIPTPTAQGPMGQVFRGDDRGFSPRSDPAKSKMFVWVNVKTNKAWVGSNASHVALPISPDFGPSSENNATVSFDERTGEYTIEYEAVIAYPLSEATAARINGTVRFRPKGQGGYESSGERDRYPAAEAYFWNDNPSLNPKAQVQTIFRRLAGKGIQNLYGIERNAGGLRNFVGLLVGAAGDVAEPIDRWSYPSNDCRPGGSC
jgi:RHS repeat-associated protein